MADSTTLTIRIDEKLKRALEQAAAAEDRSVTDFVIRAVKARMAPQCPTCGRSHIPAAAPAGLTPAMDAFLEEVRKASNGRIPIVLTTLEAGQPRVYHGYVNDEDNRGAVVLSVMLGGEIGSIAQLPVPRGLITGWGFDQSWTYYRTYLRLGYADGNALLEGVAATRAPGRPR